MFYLHHKVCLSAQNTFKQVNIAALVEDVDNKMLIKEFAVEGVPNNILRRMGKAVKYGVATALPLFTEQPEMEGIIIGTANGGMEDCIKFLNQIMEYEEGMLTPTNFVQSTTNAIASQLGFFSKNKGYNITHTQRGVAFENAMLDAAMLLKENKNSTYLLGGIDEISDYNFNIERLSGQFKEEKISNLNLYESTTKGSIAGEGAAMFVINNLKEGATSFVRELKIVHSDKAEDISQVLKNILSSYQKNDDGIDLFLSGENGDSRHLHFYELCEKLLAPDITTLRFKHMCGEYQTASSFALFLADELLRLGDMPQHMIKKRGTRESINRILLYNNYQGYQHSFIVIERV